MNNLDNRINKALDLFNKKKYIEAKSIFLDLIKNPKVNKKVYFILHETCIRLNDTKDAKKYLVKFVELDDKNYIALNKLANLYVLERQIEKAEKLYLKAIESKSDYLTAIVNLALFYQGVGDIENAKKFYYRAIDLSPKNFAVFYNLSKIDKDFMNSEKIELIERTLKNEKLDSLSIASGYFLLAENHKKKNQIIDEMKKLEIAHRYTFEANLNSNKQSVHYWINIMPKKYDRLNFNLKKNNFDIKSLSPIFIVGLPRSGSTILESIISSGKEKILNLGETGLINWSIISTHKEIFTEGKKGEEKLLSLDKNLICKKLSTAFENLGVSNTKNNVFIEKSLENFFYIELILKILPKAKFINSVRNMNDNLFAIYQQFLAKNPWTHSFENILNYVNNYLKIMSFFKKKYPNKIFSVNLEELINNKEEISKRLYNFCELEWSHKALEFYKRKDLFSSTASNVQIRSNLYKYDKEKYSDYKIFLKKFSDQYKWIEKD
jgi:tetratricopeptide (TPR) repeat protein